MVKVGDSLVDEFGKLADQGGVTYTKFFESRKPQRECRHRKNPEVSLSDCMRVSAGEKPS
jgi:hypothetical protein